MAHMHASGCFKLGKTAAENNEILKFVSEREQQRKLRISDWF
jgi:hypothetical protein